MAPMSVRITPLPHGRAEVQWAADPQIKAYRVEYRVAGNPANAWFGYDSEGSTYTLTGLQENTAYEVRVGTVCDQARTVFSDPTTFTTLMTRKVDLADCGVRPDIRISNREPMELLRQGDVVMAGDFAVTLLRVQGGNGRFSGIGYVDVPFLGFVRLAVKFDNIEVNTEGQLIGGFFNSIFDVDWEEKDAPTFSEIGNEVKEIGELLFDVVTKLLDKKDKLKELAQDPEKNKEELLGLLEDVFDSEGFVEKIQKSKLPEEKKQDIISKYEDAKKQTRTASTSKDSKDIDNAVKATESLFEVVEGAREEIERLAAKDNSEAGSKAKALNELTSHIDYDKLLGWLRDNFGKTVDYDYRLFLSKEFEEIIREHVITSIPIDKKYTAVIDGKPHTFNLEGKLSLEKGKVRLTRDRISGSVEVLDNTVHFGLFYYFETGDSVAISLSTKRHKEMQHIFEQQGIRYTDHYSEEIVSGFKSALRQTNTIDYILAEAPDFVLKTFSDEEKWAFIKKLESGTFVTDRKERAILNVVAHITPSFLASRVNEDIRFAMRLLKRFDRQDDFIAVFVNALSTTWTGQEEPRRVITSLDNEVSKNMYVVTCLSTADNTIKFGSGLIDLNKSTVADCNEATVQHFTGTYPTVLSFGGDDIIVPAFISAEILAQSIEKGYRELLSLNVGLLLPELLIAPSKLAGYTKFLKGKKEGTVNVDKTLGNIDGFLRELDWTDATRNLLRSDLDNSKVLKELFENASVSERTALAKSWNALNDAGHTNLRKTNDALIKLTDLSTNKKLIELKVDIRHLAEISGVSGKSYTDVLDNISKVIDNLDVKGIKLENFDDLVKSLGRDYNFRDGANWTLEYIGKNLDDFSGKKLTFEDMFKTDAGRRYVDVSVTETSGRKVLYEFKSVQEVPPNNFSEQFLKDLSNREVTSLDQIRWVFDGKKNPANFKQNMERAIDNMDTITKDLAEKFIGERNINKFKKTLKENLENVFIKIDVK